LIPIIGKENLLVIKKTKLALEKIATQILLDKPDVIITITSHGPSAENKFVINSNLNYGLNFRNFGDFSINRKLLPDFELIGLIQLIFENTSSLVALSEDALDHGSGVPLYYVLEKYSNFKLVPLHTSCKSLASHYEFGVAMQEELIKTNKKITILASGELSHRLSQNSPSGYHSQAKKFDHRVIEALKEKDIDKMLNIDDLTIKGVYECGLKPIVTLLGVLDKYNFIPQDLSYEKPFGIGHLALKFHV